MDVAAEISDLKLRIEDLEMALRTGDATPDGPGRRCPYGGVLADICTRVQSIQADVTATSTTALAIRADIADVQHDVSQEFAALTVEVAGLRSQLQEHVTRARGEALQRFDFLLCEMLDLAFRLDRLLGKGGA